MKNRERFITNRGIVMRPQTKGEDLQRAYDKYCESHTTPGNPNGILLSEQLASVRPIEYSFNGFARKMKTNIIFRFRWTVGRRQRD